MSSKVSSTKSVKQCREKDKKLVSKEEVFLETLSSQGNWGDDFSPSPFPLQGNSVDEMLLYLLELREKYPDYHLTFKLEKSPRLFGEVNWWELKGVRRG